MQLKDEREYLENELKSYRKIVDMYDKYEQQMNDIVVAKEGISSPRFKDVIYENTSNPYECKYNMLNEEFKEATKKQLPWEERKWWIEDRLAILNKTEYRIIKYRYMMSTKATYEWIADVIPCCKNTVINTIDRVLEKMLDFK